MKAVKILAAAMMLLAISSAGVLADTPVPTDVPTDIPTYAPTTAPTDIPTDVPTSIPTELPTTVPTAIPGLATPVLIASHSAGGTTLQWPTDGAATTYYIYEADGAAGKFAAFPSGWTLVSTIAPGSGTTSYVVPDGADNTYNTYSYFVVTSTDGASVSAASNIATRVNFYMEYMAGTLNNYLPSLPYFSQYTSASVIAAELTNLKTNRIAVWDAPTQTSVPYFYTTMWKGTDWANDAGTAGSNGFYMTVKTSFNWVVTGVDNNPALAFAANAGIPSDNIRQIPYSCTYKKASDIVLDIEGSLSTKVKILRIAVWDAGTQSFVPYFFSGGTWKGTNFDVVPGASINITASPGSSFNWTPSTVVAQ